MSTQSHIIAAAVVYRANEHDRLALADLARELAAAGYQVGGVVQEVLHDEQGRRIRIDSVDLATGERVTINQANRGGPDDPACTLDTAALTDSGAPLRRVLIDRPDVVVVEKFGEQEQNAAGLMDEILGIIAEGLPILVLVPEAALASWRELTGGVTAEVPCEIDALRRWWQAQRHT